LISPGTRNRARGNQRVSKGSIGGGLRVGDKVSKSSFLVEDKVNLLGTETDGGELGFVKDVPGSLTDLDGLIQKNATGLSIIVARIGVHRRGGTFGPSADGSTGCPGGGTGFIIAILVESEAVLGELEDRLFSFLGGRNLILGASGVPAVGAGLFGNGHRNLILPGAGLFALALVVVGLALGGGDSLNAGSNEATEVLVEMTDLVTFLLAVTAGDSKSRGLVDLVVVLLLFSFSILESLLSGNLAAVVSAGLGESAGHFK